MKPLELENEDLAVELDAGRPMVLGLTVKPGGARMGGARPEGVLRVNGQASPWPQAACGCYACTGWQKHPRPGRGPCLRGQGPGFLLHRDAHGASVSLLRRPA